jgi:hypothetical protein
MRVIARRSLAVTPAQVHTATFSLAIAGPAVLGARLSDAAPTGVPFADHLWVAALIATVAYLTSTAKRWTWFVPAAAGAAMAGSQWAVAVAAVAILIGLYSVVTDTRSRARGALVGGLGMVAIQGAAGFGFHGTTAIVAAVALVPPCASGYRYAGRRAKAKIRKVGGWAGAVCLVVLAGAAIGVISTYQDLIEGTRRIDDGLAAAREADDDLASASLGEAVRHLTSADDTLSSWFVAPARLLPVVGPNIEAVGSLTHDAAEVAEVTADAADTADVDSLRFVGGRLNPRAVTNMRGPLEASLASVEALAGTLDDASQSPWLVTPLASRVDLLRTELDDAIPDGQAAIEAIDHAPWLLGADAPRRYLVLFVTPVEARGRTGFPGNFAELVVDNGKLSMPRFGRVTELEEQGIPGDARQLTQPPEYLARYSRFDPKTTWRNLTMSPDFPSVSLVAKQLYPQSTGKNIDGVLSIDPLGLATLLRYTGAVDIEGLDEPLDADNAAQFLLLDQYVEFTDRDQRIDVLETVARTTFERLTSADLPSPRALADAFDPMVDGGHIQFAPFDLPTYVWIDGFGLPGRMSEFRGDTLGVTTSNTGGSKIDLFLQRQLRYEVTWDPATHQVKGTITLALTNNSPAEGLDDVVIGNLIDRPRGTNSSFLSVYTPLFLDAARIDGRPVAMEPGLEFERNVYSRFVEIPAGGTVLVELDVSGTIESNDYVLDLYQQPLVHPESAEVGVTVAGDDTFTGEIDGPSNAEVTTEGRTAHWKGPLDRRTDITVTPDG